VRSEVAVQSSRPSCKYVEMDPVTIENDDVDPIASLVRAAMTNMSVDLIRRIYVLQRILQ